MKKGTTRVGSRPYVLITESDQAQESGGLLHVSVSFDSEAEYNKWLPVIAMATGRKEYLMG